MWNATLDVLKSIPNIWRYEDTKPVLYHVIWGSSPKLDQRRSNRKKQNEKREQKMIRHNTHKKKMTRDNNTFALNREAMMHLTGSPQEDSHASTQKVQTSLPKYI